MSKTSPSKAGGAGSIPGWGAKFLHDLRPKNQFRAVKCHPRSSSYKALEPGLELRSLYLNLLSLHPLSSGYRSFSVMC